MNMNTPCRAFIKSVMIQMKCVEPNQMACAHDRMSAIHVMPITITSFIQMRPNVVLLKSMGDEPNNRNCSQCIHGREKKLTLISHAECVEKVCSWPFCVKVTKTRVSRTLNPYRSVVDLTFSCFHRPQVRCRVVDANINRLIQSRKPIGP